MANLNTYRLDDLVRDPTFDFLNKLGPNDPETEHNHDFLSTDLSDSPYSNSAFHTKYFFFSLIRLFSFITVYLQIQYNRYAHYISWKLIG